MTRAYFDWAATAPFFRFPDSDVCPFGNPSSAHAEGRAARDALEGARRRCAAVLGVPPNTLYFTSGGSESNALVILAQLSHIHSSRSFSCVTSDIEHASCLANFKTLEQFGVAVRYLKPDSSGHIQPSALAKLPDSTRLVSIQAVNNESGAVQDVAALAGAVREGAAGGRVHIHSDCVQALGKLPCNPAAWGLDSASFAAHKIGGPRGIGLLYLKRPLEVFVRGGGQEGGLRPGTENVAGALQMAACMERLLEPQTAAGFYRAACGRMCRLLEGLSRIPRCTVLPAARRGLDAGLFSPYIAAAAFRDIPGEVMVRALDDAGFAVSTGAACSQAGRKGGARSRVFAAMGVDAKTLSEVIRISQGFSTTDAELDALVEALERLCRSL
ncbi:MAG: cysteine desulfurase [Spirochaetaceae bacterium]|nr:cysteine desulfurase [Spirochaetaceae bacterium]